MDNEGKLYDNDGENEQITESADKSAVENNAEAVSANGEDLGKEDGEITEIVRKRTISTEIFEWIETLATALAIVIIVFTFIFRIVTVQGGSMMNTLVEKDNLVISHLFYSPKGQDIVVIQVPEFSDRIPIIKRVIATEGQTVDFDFENWKVIVDGVTLDEPYVNFESDTFMKMYNVDVDMLPITVEKGKIFVMGDNRNHSTDSRSSSIKQVDVRNVVGKVILRVYPLNKFGVVKPSEK